MSELELSQAKNPEHPTSAEDPAEDFAALFESGQFAQETLVSLDSKIEGTIVSIGEEWVFVDIGGKSEGAISREDLLDDTGELPFNLGDSITAYVVGNREGEIQLSIKMTVAASEEAIQGAKRSGVPVEGLVLGERKGGFSVSVLGKSAFCPYSQIDLQPYGEASNYVGKKFSFRITEYSDKGRNIVISRRAILEEERRERIACLEKQLRPGDVVDGEVRRLAQFGAFVDIGGVEGLIPIAELAWHRVTSASDVLTPGDEIKVKVLDLDWEHNRISLSRKQTLIDPWDSVSQRYVELQTFTGIVTKLMNFGAFVQLEPGIEGLIHISNLGTGRRIGHPREVLREGEEVRVRVLSADTASKRIGLELISSEIADGVLPEQELGQGDLVTGIVDAVKDYGVFVKLPGGKSGLMHLSEIAADRTGDLRSRFPVGSSLDVQIISIDPVAGKISVSTRSLGKRKEEAQFKEFKSELGATGSLGTLGDLLRSKIES